MRVHGMAHFSLGEKALVFLKKSKDGLPALVGMAQGKYKIVQDRNTGEERAQFIAPPDVEFYESTRRGVQQHVHAQKLHRDVSLKNLIKEIREVR